MERMDNLRDKARMRFGVPRRGLLGFGPEIAAATRGTAAMHHCHPEERERTGVVDGGGAAGRGKLVCNETGAATLYALEFPSARGTLFVAPGNQVDPGTVGGVNVEAGNLEANPFGLRRRTTKGLRARIIRCSCLLRSA